MNENLLVAAGKLLVVIGEAYTRGSSVIAMGDFNCDLRARRPQDYQSRRLLQHWTATHRLIIWENSPGGEERLPTGVAGHQIDWILTSRNLATWVLLVGAVRTTRPLGLL